MASFPVDVEPSGWGDIAAGKDGNMWFSVQDSIGRSIGRIAPTGAITLFPVPTPGASIGDITAGPGGSMWFTAGDKVGRIDEDGEITEYVLPAGSGSALGITSGPANDLWFTAMAEEWVWGRGWTFHEFIGTITSGKN